MVIGIKKGTIRKEDGVERKKYEIMVRRMRHEKEK